MTLKPGFDTDGIDFRLLRTLVTLVTERNVSRAADRLGISQPAASHALGRLRTIFGDPLLLRSRDGMVPTDRATEIVRDLRSIIGEFERLIAAPDHFNPELSRRTFVVTGAEHAEFALFPSFLARVRAEAPNVRVEIRPPFPEKSVEWLESGEIDLRVGWVHEPTPSLRSQALYRDQLVCIARRDHSGISGTLSLSQFMELPQVRPQFASRTTTGRAIDEAIAAIGGRINIAVLVQNYLTIPYMVAESDMIAILPMRLAVDCQKKLPIRILAPPLKLPRMRNAAFWHERSHKDPGHQWLRKVLKTAARNLDHANSRPSEIDGSAP